MMTPSQTLRIISFLDPREPSVQTDLSWLAVRQVRALVNADMPVQWQILQAPTSLLSGRQAQAPVELTMSTIESMAQHDTRLADLTALFRSTRIDDGDADNAEVMLAMTPPEWWAPLLVDGPHRRIAYLERSIHWPLSTLARLCATCDEIWLPDGHWAEALHEVNPALNLAVMPPIRLHRASCNIDQQRLDAFQSSLDVTAESFVFLCSLDSHAVQDCGHMLGAWEQAFGKRLDIDVSLILHCPPQFNTPTGFVESASWIEEQLKDAQHTGVILLNQHLNGDGEDLLRASAQVLLVANHGDGLGLRVMDAVDAGNAVVAPARKDLEEWFGMDWQGYASPEALAQALADAYDHVFDESARRTMIQWRATNHLSEAAFVQRVNERLKMQESLA
ncbi:glycosyltransferase [Diaphorobacter caeni]|uniref:glycosyltransferase n=1 Tax=Diaphorobacter caeni TaxID=2784387 RepID=UPI0018908F66|nr:glycosyltransferase [Diaphorobacter caeni]MBF5004252.1 glycosyltransferase [Diaphorobacter caeni]